MLKKLYFLNIQESVPFLKKFEQHSPLSTNALSFPF